MEAVGSPPQVKSINPVSHEKSFSPASFNLQSTQNEWHNIDSMDVSPDSGRWAVTNTGFTETCDDGVLHIQDTGDGTDDRYYLERDLRDRSGSVEIRFKMGSNSTAAGYYKDAWYIQITGDAGLNGNDRMYTVLGVDGDGFGIMELKYYDSPSSTKAKYLAGTERPENNTWYILNLDYDQVESDFRYRLYHDNGTKLLDYEWQDISAGSERPEYFGDTESKISFYIRSYTSGKRIDFWIDYVKAPFAEQKWELQSGSGTDSDWLDREAPTLVKWQDTVSNQWQDWDLVVPNLDSVSGVMRLSIDDITQFANQDGVSMTFKVKCIDADDGGEHDAFGFKIGTYQDNAGVDRFEIYIYEDGVLEEYTEIEPFTTGDLFLSFGIATYDDRSKMGMKALWGWDNTNESAVDETVGSVEISDVATDPSQEFMLTVIYTVLMTGNTEGEMWLESFDFTTNDFFKELGEIVTKGPMGYFLDKVVDGFEGAIFGLFEGLFEHLGKFIAWAFEVALEFFPEEFRTWTNNLMTDIAGLWDGLWAIFGEWIDDIWAEIENWIDDIIDEGLAHIMNVLTDVANAFSAIVFEAWDSSWTALGVNIPDLLGVIEAVSWFTIEIITSFPDWIDDINDLQAFWTFEKIVVLIFIFLIFIPFMMGTSNKDGFSNIAKVNSYQIALVPIGVLLFVVAGALGLF